ncbi:MAG: DUF3987 domain-containing protein [Prevotella ruminicola]|uniref:DUF3987 domain-containing protein n=1 Tax=Xylanibacter ruminicola TaxID=839 RepID=A0A9D5S834_XYLRU|nr:DUF3987 domain-containing protein [Xylanibacter ruminicola]
MNYSCLPNEDGTLKGSTRMSTTVGMDIDHLQPEEMPAVRDRILAKKDELGLKMMEESARGGGFHLVFARKPEMSQEENLKWASELISVAYDSGAKDITRVFFTTGTDQLIYLDDALFAADEVSAVDEENPSPQKFPGEFKGVPYTDIIAEFWRRTGGVPTEGERNKRLHQLAANLRSICDDSEEWLLELMPSLGLPESEVRSIIHSACKEPTKGSRLMDQIVATLTSPDYEPINPDDQKLSTLRSQLSVKKLPQGVRDSVAAVGAGLAMPVITAICPCIGTLATGVQLDVHGTKRGLNLIAYIAGDFASGKGGIDPVVEAWMSELQALDKMYQMQEDEWRAKKRAAKNKKEQPEEPKLPVRCLTLNNTVANLAERLANTQGKHGFSFTPEADTVAQKWKSSMSDFSVMLRQSYDGSKYEREARSADAVNVHIEHLLWNVCMCGTPDALYRVVNNYTDGFQSRIAVAHTPDNTFAPLEDKPNVLTDRQRDRIQQVAHLLPLMYGEVVLPKLEAKGREWLEKIRLETMKNDDRTRARQRFRVCVTAQRMVCCLMLCKVCETLIQKHGLTGAEAQLKQKPGLWKELLLKAQTPTMLEAYDVIADQLLETALYFFRDRIENAFLSRDYAGGQYGERAKRGKNDSIFERLDVQFTFDQAMQHSVAIKGAQVNINTVRQMLKNWRKQKLVVLEENGNYRKMVG